MISAITPTHDPSRLRDVYESLRAQTMKNWQWIVIANGGLGDDDIPEFADTRVRFLFAPKSAQGSIGALKRYACDQATGDILLELDHDDLLMPTALEKVAKAFDDNPDVGMVYSNCARANEDWSPNLFADGYGWQYREGEAFGHRVQEVISPEPLPQNLSRIWYAPDHLRAWRTSDYHLVGGHNPQMKIADDHDLICRFYLESKILHLDECLYVYRIRGDNSWLRFNADVQALQWENYERYAHALALRWANDSGLGAIDLHQNCTGFNLDAPWPFEDNSIGLIEAHDRMTSAENLIHFFNEVYRVLAPGGFFFSLTPSTNGKGAWCDPTNRSFVNDLSFRYYTDASCQQYIKASGADCRFQEIRVRELFPTEWHQSVNMPYVQADLIALKDGLRFHGAVNI